MTVNKFYFLTNFILHDTPMFFRINFCVMLRAAAIGMMMMCLVRVVCSVIQNNITIHDGGASAVTIVIAFMSCGNNGFWLIDNLILVICLILTYVSHCIY